jgi:hypothetical protein
MDRDFKWAFISLGVAFTICCLIWTMILKNQEKYVAPVINTTEIKIDSLSQKPVGPGRLKKVDSNDHMTVYEYTKDGESYIVFSSEYEFLSVVKK